MNSDNDKPLTAPDRRNNGREPFQGTITLRFESDELIGSGENISGQGVHFVLEAAPEVTVEIAGEAEPRVGQLMRLQPLEQGRVGIAVRFE